MGQEQNGSEFNLEDWAQDFNRFRARSCHTCKVPGVKEAVRKVLELRAEGKSVVSMAALHSILEEHYAYPYSVSSLRYHVRKCEKELWNEIKGR